MNVTMLFVILAVFAALMFLTHVLTHKRDDAERWLRQEGYVPPTPEEAEQARREKLYGKFRGGE
jgi:hypothetical protein